MNVRLRSNCDAEKDPGSIDDPTAGKPQEECTSRRDKALEHYASVPKYIKRRVVALKRLQIKHCEIEVEFYKRMNLLEKDYFEKYAPLFERRRYILTGDCEPTAEECTFEPDLLDLNPETGEEFVQEFEEKATVEESKVAGIPEFWLTVLKNVGDIAVMLQEHDFDVLRYLIDIQCRLDPSPPSQGFQLIFTFGENPYFSNETLTKDYVVRFDAITHPFEYEGPEIVESKGCTIKWFAGKNVTVGTVKKRLRSKKSGERKTTVKEVRRDSFFHFFDAEKKSIEKFTEEGGDYANDSFTDDFHIGQLLREKVIPRAVLYYTGEGIECDDTTVLDGSELDYQVTDSDASVEKSPKGQKSGTDGKENKDATECKQQ